MSAMTCPMSSSIHLSHPQQDPRLTESMDANHGSEPSFESVHRVFEIYELLELILLQLPMRDLLHAQTVSRSWKTLITSSRTLQQALFLAPKPQRDQKLQFDEQWEINELLRVPFSPWFDLDYVRSKWDWPTAAAIKELGWAKDKRKLKAFMRAEASWRRMLVCQPAITDLQILVKFDYGRFFIGDDHIRFASSSPSQSADATPPSHPHEDEDQDPPLPGPGVTMGLLYDIASDFTTRKHLVSRFYVQWRPLQEPDRGGYVSDDDDDPDEGYIDQPNDITGFGTPSWRRRDVEPLNSLSLHLCFTAQFPATLLPEPRPELRSAGYEDVEVYRRLLISTAKLMEQAMRQFRVEDVVDEPLQFIHPRHRRAVLTWDPSDLHTFPSERGNHVVQSAIDQHV